MGVALVTGSNGLIGSESVRFFAGKGFDTIGIDNDMRSHFFGPSASTQWMRRKLARELKGYRHYAIDIRELAALEKVFKRYGRSIHLIIHTAAQPSHDWAAKDPLMDFGINANGTLNLLELTRRYCPQTVFIFTSTNKVYGDRPNSLPLRELKTRWDLSQSHRFYKGIDESLSVDACLHSLFGASKLAADILVQEYGEYFGMKTVCFRGGCLTGPNHSGAELHGFLSYLMKCALNGKTYNIFGYEGKQVRDNIHSFDLVNAFYHVFQNPRMGEVYNIGGGRENSCSVLEAIKLCEEITGRQLFTHYEKTNRRGDHIWYITNLQKFQSHYPRWKQKYNLQSTLQELAHA